MRAVAPPRPLQAFAKQAIGKPYETNKKDMVRACFPGCENTIDDQSSYFCSELVAAAYQEVGILPQQPPASNYLPLDFGSVKRGALPLQGTAQLSPKVVVVSKREESCW